MRNLPATTLVLLILGAALLIDLVGIVALSLGVGGAGVDPRPIPQVLELVAVTTVTGMLALLAPNRQQAAEPSAGQHRGDPAELS